MRYAKRLVLGAGMAAFGLGASAYAALGESANSINTDAAVFHTLAQPRASASQAYTVQRMTLPSGILVDQFVSPSGVVFAVSWRGMRPPDLAQLFGSYFDEYQAAAMVPRQRRGPVKIDTGRMTYQTGGHMRDLWGSALVPALLPAGLRAEDLK